MARIFASSNNGNGNNNINNNISNSRRSSRQPFVQATKDDTETWSKSASAPGRRESRLGVRRRVRDVLKRARERTGVANDSELLGSDSNLGLEATSSSSSRSSSSRPKLDFGIDSDILGVDASLASAGLPLVGETDVVPPSVNTKRTSRRNGVATPPSTVMASTTVASSSTAAAIPAKRNGVSQTTVRGGQTADSSSDDTEQQPLPFTLPILSSAQQDLLQAGERVQEQSRMGGEGTGFVVMDIPAPEYAIWECLLDFQAYPENIGTVRSMRMFTNKKLEQSYFAETPLPKGAVTPRHYGQASISRAAFVLSKFRLNIAAVHKYVPHPDGHYMVFTLDRATKNAVLQDAKGIWYTEANPEGKDGVTRVWLLCELSVSPLFPTFIVDYAAKRAMPRATTWLPIAVDQYMQKWKKFMDV